MNRSLRRLVVERTSAPAPVSSGEQAQADSGPCVHKGDLLEQQNMGLGLVDLVMFPAETLW